MWTERMGATWPRWVGVETFNLLNKYFGDELLTIDASFLHEHPLLKGSMCPAERWHSGPPSDWRYFSVPRLQSKRVRPHSLWASFIILVNLNACRKSLNWPDLELAARQSGRLLMPLGFESCFSEVDCEQVVRFRGPSGRRVLSGDWSDW